MLMDSPLAISADEIVRTNIYIYIYINIYIYIYRDSSRRGTSAHSNAYRRRILRVGYRFKGS